MARLVRIADRQKLIDQPPGEPRPQVRAQRELRRRLVARDEHPRAAVARLVDRHEQRLLGGRLERFDVIRHHQRRICAPRRAQQVAASRSRFPP